MKRSVLFTSIAVISLLLCWLVGYFIIGNEYLLPSPWEAAVSAWELLGQGGFYLSLLNTFGRTMSAFLISFAIGVGLALLSVFFGWLRGFLAPVVSFLRTLPTMAVILALLVWTNPLVAPVVVTVLVLFPVVYAQALAAFDGVTAEYGQFVRAYGVGWGRKIGKMYLPLAAPAVLSQCGSLISMGIKVMVSAEVLSSTFQSLGGMMTEAQIYLNMPRLLALTVAAVLLGFLVEGVCALLFKKIVRWRV